MATKGERIASWCADVGVVLFVAGAAVLAKEGGTAAYYLTVAAAVVASMGTYRRTVGAFPWVSRGD